MTIPALAVVFAAPTTSFAQPTTTPGDAPRALGHLMLRGMEEKGVEAQRTAELERVRTTGDHEAFVLPEGAVDPHAYVLGPDDRLELAIWGAAEMYHALVVSPEGSVFVPGVGVVTLSGRTLAEGRAALREAVLEVFTGVEVDVLLIGLRRFKVHVVGAVLVPGSYPATAVTRASEVIDLAGGVLESASLRRARMRSPGGEERWVDLVAYQLAGLTERNPFLVDGAIVEVPRRTRSLIVAGAVSNPGTYEPLPGERVSDVLRAIGGLEPSADSTAVSHTRFVSADETESRTFRYVPGDPDGDPVIGDGDAVYVRARPDFHRLGEAFVVGAVLRPGRYPIPIEGIPLSTLVPLAGGFTARANLAQAHLIRPRERFTPDPRLVDAVRTPTTAILTDQVIMESAADSTIVRADFRALFDERDERADVLVRDGDIVQVPEDRADVRVLGLVRSPGAYPFVQGASFGDYVAAAGGYDKDADKGRTRFAPFYGAPLRQIDRSKPISSGAILFVPGKERRSFLERTRDLTGIVVQLASLILVIDRLAR